MPNSEHSQRQAEILAFRGRLRLDLSFELIRSYSTRDVRRWPNVKDATYHLELRDEHDHPINRELVAVYPSVDCEAGIPAYHYVRGYIALREGAQELRFFKQDVLIESFRIPEAPKLKLHWKPARVSRDGQHELEFEFSQPRDGAFLQLVYQWGEGKHQTLGFFRPRKSIPVTFGDLPGGKRCRIVVLYSNGLRAVGQATRYFSLPAKRPSLEILQPAEGSVFAPWVPIEVRGQITDAEVGAVADNQYGWLVDGKPVAQRPAASVEQLTEGKHVLTLRYDTGEGGRQDEVSTAFHVKRPKLKGVLPAHEWDA